MSAPAGAGSFDPVLRKPRTDAARASGPAGGAPGDAGTLRVVRRFIGQGANEGFTCAVCGADVPALANGSYRNHCPVCLCSLHVDVNPGDRASDCGGVLEAVAAEYSGKKGWIIVHRCRRCGEVRRNRAALDDPVWPDDYERLVALASGDPTVHGG